MTKISSRFLSAAFALGIVVAAHSPASAASVMSAEQIMSEIVDRAFAYKGIENGQRRQGRIYYETNGTVRILTREGVRDGGVWKVDGDGTFCTKITLGRGNQVKCFSIFEWRHGKYATDHGYFLYPVENRRFSGG